MDATTYPPLHMNGEEAVIVAGLLESERAKLLIEIRHTDHRIFREELRRRLGLVEALLSRCGAAAAST